MIYLPFSQSIFWARWTLYSQLKLAVEMKGPCFQRYLFKNVVVKGRHENKFHSSVLLLCLNSSDLSCSFFFFFCIPFLQGRGQIVFILFSEMLKLLQADLQNLACLNNLTLNFAHFTTALLGDLV